MANFILDNTAEEINEAIHKVTNPDTNLSGTLNDDPSLITAGAVKTYVDDSIENKKLSTGYQTLNNSGTASSDGFLIIKIGNVGNNFFQTTTATVNIGGLDFTYRMNSTQIGHMCLPIANGESYSASYTQSADLSVTFQVRFKALA